MDFERFLASLALAVVGIKALAALNAARAWRRSNDLETADYYEQEADRLIEEYSQLKGGFDGTRR